MKTTLVLVSMLLCFALGFTVDRQLYPQPTRILMPIRLIDADMARLLVLAERGGTYTRLAKGDGTMGIVAVRQKSGTWIVPTEEVTK